MYLTSFVAAITSSSVFVCFVFFSLPFMASANWPSQHQLSDTGTQTSLYNALATAGTVASLSG